MLSHLLKVSVASLALSVFAIGCASERHEDIPPRAMLSAEGAGVLTYTAPEDGTIYVYDARGDRLVYTGDVEKGQTFQVDPSERRITLDGRVIQDKALATGNQHKIFFEQDARAAAEKEEMKEMKEDIKEMKRSEVQPAGSGSVIIEDVEGKRTTELRPAEEKRSTDTDAD